MRRNRGRMMPMLIVLTALLGGLAAETAAGQAAVHAADAPTPPRVAPTATAVQVQGVAGPAAARQPDEAPAPPAYAPTRPVGVVHAVRSVLYPEPPIWPPAPPSEPAFRPAAAASSWDGLALLHEARLLARRLTSFEFDRVRVRVDPLEPRCTVYVNLSTQAILFVPLAAAEACGVDG